MTTTNHDDRRREKASPLRALRDDFRALATSPRELWIVYAVKFLESVAYFAIYNLLVIYLSADLGYSDTEAGVISGTWLTAVSVFVFMAGFVADSLGIRRAMLVSVTSCLAGRLVLAASSTRAASLAGLAVMSWGVASMMPTMTAAVRQYTRKRTVSFGFSFFYVMMNVGALVAPLTIGRFRRLFPHGTDLAGAHLSSSRLVFVVGVGATALALGLTLLMRPDAEVERAARAARDGDDDDEHRPAASPLAALREVVFEANFWRFMLFVSLLVLVKLIFQHAHQTWPKYSLREFGEDFPFADYWAINPAMIIVLTPAVTALTRHRSAFACILWGSVLTACSVFFMAVSTTVAASVAFIVTLSLSEALWSPRIYEYTATIAPRGREASYMGLSQLPMFLAKPAVGGLSGWLLTMYCPASGPRDSHTMWWIIGLTTLAGPVAMWFLQGVIRPKPAAREGVAAAA